MDLATLLSIATAAAKYGPEIVSLFRLGETYEALAEEIVAAVTPVIERAIQGSALAPLADDTLAQINGILETLDQPQLSSDQKAAVSAAEQEWMDRASQSIAG